MKMKNIEQILLRIPPDFDKAEIHGVTFIYINNLFSNLLKCLMMIR